MEISLFPFDLILCPERLDTSISNSRGALCCAYRLFKGRLIQRYVGLAATLLSPVFSFPRIFFVGKWINQGAAVLHFKRHRECGVGLMNYACGFAGVLTVPLRKNVYVCNLRAAQWSIAWGVNCNCARGVLYYNFTLSSYSPYPPGAKTGVLHTTYICISE